jgi:aminopeptidase N
VRPRPLRVLGLALFAVVPGHVSAQAPPEVAPAPTAEVVVHASPIESQADMEAVFDGFFKVPLDLDHPWSVKGLRLKRDTLELTLAGGTLYLAQPIGGMVTGACYVGPGSMKVTVPNASDRKLLADSYGKPVFQESFDQVALRFDDGAEKEIAAAATPGGAPIANAAETWASRMRIEDDSSRLELDFLESRLDDLRDTSFFTAAIHTPANESYSFSHRGRDPIEVALFREKPLDKAGKRRYESISRFHRPEDYDASGNYDLVTEADNKMPAAMNHIRMTITIPNTKSVQIDADLTVKALRDGVRSVRFDLINNLEWKDEKDRPVTVERVLDDTGHPLPYLHRKHQLLVLLPETLNRGDTTHVLVQATEDTIVPLTSGSFYIYSDADWYPRTSSGAEAARHTFDWTVKVVNPMLAAGSGDLQRRWEEGNLSCGQWTSDIPVRFASFIFGHFKVTEDRFESEATGGKVVPLRLYARSSAQSLNPKSVLYNIKQGMKTYESVLGPFPFGDLDIAEMAHNLGFAQAPPGILFIGESLGTAGGGGISDQVIFHELAHQWWGHQVGRAGVEDTWIDEAWAEYTAMLITEAIDKSRAREQRDGWREKALAADRYGTISTAYRSQEEYDLLYKKGPCVLHMLRTWMGWEKFTQYMATLQTKYRNTNINTDTLAREASKALGYDMFPFFDQWVRDRGIPKVHYSWSAAPEAGGKQIVTITLRQEDEANFKVLMLPIALDFGQKESTIVQKPVLKARQEIQLRVPQVPKKITMDPGETQLAIFINDDKK